MGQRATFVLGSAWFRRRSAVVGRGLERLPRPRDPALRRALLLILALSLYRWAALALSGFEMYSDEAYYWTWSLEPAFGYYSKPPMVAWAIGLLRGVCGDGEVCIKSGGLLLYAASALLVFCIGRRLGGARLGLTAAVLYATLPFVSLYSWFMTTDALLCFFWAAALLLLLRALERGRRADWLWTGVSVGLGLLSKYTMVVFPASALLYLLTDPAGRHRLRTAGPWLAALLAVVVFAPNLLWNWAHDFPSFRHTAEISQLDRKLVHPDHLLEFLASQFFVFGPLSFGLLLACLTRLLRLWQDPSRRLLLCFTLPMLGGFALLSFLTRANYNWALPAYVAGSLLLAGWLQRRPRLLAAVVVLNLSLGLFFYHRVTIARWVGAEAQLIRDPLLRKQTGWRPLGREVSAMLRAHPGAGLASDDRNLLAELLYYVRPAPPDAAIFNPRREIRDHYALTRDIADRPPRPFLLVSQRGHIAEELRARYRRVEELPAVVLEPLPGYRRNFRVFLIEDFAGY